MSTFTPLGIISAASIMDNKGLEINTDMVSAFDTYNTDTAFSSKIQTLLAENPNDEDLKAAAAAMPPFLSGMVPSTTTVPDGFNTTNLSTAIHDQAKCLFNPTTGAAGFLGVLSTANGYAAKAFTLHGVAAQAQNTNFSDCGFMVENHCDVLTGGITNQFDAEHLPALANDIGNFGTMYNVSKLDSMFDPAEVCQHLVDQGLGSTSNLGPQLAEAQATWVDNPAQLNNTLLNIMGGIKGSELSTIISVTNFTPSTPGSIQCLADVLQCNNVLSPAGQLALGNNPSLPSLSNKLGNIGGSFASSGDVATLYKSIDTTSDPMIKGMTDVLPGNIASMMISNLGTGSGVFGNPMVGDMVGAVSGNVYTDRFQSMLSLQTQVAGTAEGSSLSQALSSIPYDTAAITNASNNLISAPSAGIQSLLSAGNSDHAACVSQLVLEKTNLLKAGIDISAVNHLLNGGLGALWNPVSGIAKLWALLTPYHVGFHLDLDVSGILAGVATDSMGLGAGAVLGKMLTPDIHGAAIRACMQEASNSKALAKNGIQPFTKIDPLQYAIKGVKSIRG